MFDLKCKKLNCEYNKNHNCKAKVVEIKSDTECETFKATEKNESLEIEKIDQPAIRKNISVECSADCIFNHQFECTANGITVQPCKQDNCPNCCTYLPK